MTTPLATIANVHAAQPVIHRHLSPAPLLRSYPLEKALGFPPQRRVWIKDFGFTPVGSFKVYGALYWMNQHADAIADRPVVAHSSGNFAAGLAYAGERYQKRVVIVMPKTAPRVKFDLTRSFGAEIRTYDIATDHQTGIRDQMTRELADKEGAVIASPYDDNDVIAGNGVGGYEITHVLRAHKRTISHFFCPASGGGLLAGQALAIADVFPDAKIIAIEPANADDFRQSLAAGQRLRVEHPQSICDGLLSYDVGEHNWPILKSHVHEALAIPDDQTRAAMRWLYQHHGLRTEPSGAIAVAGLLEKRHQLDSAGDIVIVLSGRNIDEHRFQEWIQ